MGSPQPEPAHAAAAEGSKSSTARTALIVGIVSIPAVAFFVPLGPVAWYLGRSLLRIADLSDRELVAARTARTIGIVTTIIWMMELLGVALVMFGQRLDRP